MSTPTLPNIRIVRYLTWLCDNYDYFMYDSTAGTFNFTDNNGEVYDISFTESNPDTCVFTMRPVEVTFENFANDELPPWLADTAWDISHDEFLAEDYKYIEQSTDVVDYVAKSLTNITDEERARLIAMLSSK